MVVRRMRTEQILDKGRGMMRGKLRRLLLASTATVGIASAAHAQMPLPSLEPAPPLTGLYIGGGAGFNWMQNQHLINATGTAGNASLQSHFGFAGIGSIGWALPNGIRVELEGDYRNNQFAHGLDFGFPARAGGREIKYGPMVNVLYDMTNLLAQTTGLTIPVLCAVYRCRYRLPVGASGWVYCVRQQRVPQCRLQ